MKSNYISTYSLLKPFLLFIILIQWTSSCTERIDIDLDDSEIRLVVEGQITNEPAKHFVKITRSANYFSNQPPTKVIGAVVTISEGNNLYPLTEEEPGLYFTEPDVAGTPGKTYQLSMIIEGKTYVATSQMKQVMPIDSIQLKLNTKETGFFDVLLFGQEPATPGDHYMWRAYKNGTLQTDSISKIIFLGDDLVNGRYINGLVVQQVEAEPEDLITLEMMAVPKDYFQFVLTLMIESRWRGGPFDGPPANIRGNISGNALGFFVAYSFTKTDRAVPD